MLFVIHGNLQLQTRLSKEPNTSSCEYGAMRKSVQRFPRYFVYKHKKLQTDAVTLPKTEPSAVRCHSLCVIINA